MKLIEARIPGTSRQRVLTSDGKEMQRQSVYMDEKSWDALKDLSLHHRIGGSVVITKLIWEAQKRLVAKQSKAK